MSTHAPAYEIPHRSGFGGVQRLYRFPNGYGASVVRFRMPSFTGRDMGFGSYTDNENEWEVAVVVLDGEGFNLTYETPITSDVIGHVADADLGALLDRIAALPAVKP